jgi:hypothetical protein
MKISKSGIDIFSINSEKRDFKKIFGPPHIYTCEGGLGFLKYASYIIY